MLLFPENPIAMAEIKIREKRKSNMAVWILILLVLLVALIVILDATEYIASPDWIRQGEVIEDDPAEYD